VLDAPEDILKFSNILAVDTFKAGEDESDEDLVKDGNIEKNLKSVISPERKQLSANTSSLLTKTPLLFEIPEKIPQQMSEFV
jgi:hypothetical protein